MKRTTVTEIDRAPNQPTPFLEASDWEDLQQACYALGGARGPRRKLMKQELAASLERRQRFSEGRLE